MRGKYVAIGGYRYFEPSPSYKISHTYGGGLSEPFEAFLASVLIKKPETRAGDKEKHQPEKLT